MNKFIYIFSFLFLIVACKTKPAKDVEITNKIPAKFQMYKTSEMASLMRTMFETNKKLRKKIINGNDIGDFNEAFLKIHTAVLTDSAAFDATFPTYAKHFIQMQKELYTVSIVKKKKQFNAIIGACISCHQDRCTGPIPKIAQLRIN